MVNERTFVTCMLRHYASTSGLWEGYWDLASECRVDEALDVKTTADDRYLLNSALQDGILTGGERRALSSVFPRSTLDLLAGDDGTRPARTRVNHYIEKWESTDRSSRWRMKIGWFELGEPVFHQSVVPIMLDSLERDIEAYRCRKEIEKLADELVDVRREMNRISNEAVLSKGALRQEYVSILDRWHARERQLRNRKQELMAEEAREFSHSDGNSFDDLFYGVSASILATLRDLSLRSEPPREFLPLVREVDALHLQDNTSGMMIGALLARWGEPDGIQRIRSLIQSGNVFRSAKDYERSYNAQVGLLTLARFDPSFEDGVALADLKAHLPADEFNTVLMLVYLKTENPRIGEGIVRELSDAESAASLDGLLGKRRFTAYWDGFPSALERSDKDWLYYESQSVDLHSVNCSLIERTFRRLPPASLARIVRAGASDEICDMALQELFRQAKSDPESLEVAREVQRRSDLPITAATAAWLLEM